MKRVCCLIILIAVSHIVFAQNGKITGKVISADSGQPLAGASLTLIEKNRTKAADQNGVFSFAKLEAGTYSIKCSYTGYEAKIIEEVIVKDNDNTDISISLDVKASDTVIVTAPKRLKAAGATVESLLIAQKNSASVSDGITAETIKKTPDTKSSDAIKRVSGASIQDDRFAIIRGLNDRYNAAFINGAPLPSTEADRKAFAFDIFPSSILDNLVIYKTATPDKSGEFAGGLIDITTKSAAVKNFTSITIGQSYNSIITGRKRFFSENKGNKDWLGLDDGTRALPDAFPSKAELLTSNQQLKAAKLFGKYKWGVKYANTRPNFNFQISKGINIERKEKEFLAAIFSINYNRAFSLTSGERNSFDIPDYSLLPTDPGYNPRQVRKYMDSIYNDEVVWAALANFSIKLNNRNSISWKNNMSVNTDNKFVKRIGNYDYTSDTLGFIKETVSWFTSDKIITSQFSGDHQVGKIKTKINWLAAYSKVNRETPNLSRTQYAGQYPDVDNIGPAILLGSSQFGGHGTTFSSSSKESIKSFKIDITQPYTFMKNTQNFIKIGAGYQIRERDFTSRVIGLVQYSGFVYQRDASIDKLPQDQIFLPQYLGFLENGKVGFSLSDGTYANADYAASSNTTHAYVMNDQRFFKKFRAIYGVRTEKFNQKLFTIKSTNSGDTVNLNTTVTDYLPSLNFVYSPTTKMNIRLSYTETLNRPEFRELAPFLFFESVSNFTIGGDENLKRAKIKNYDFRYEYFPGKAQLLSFSVFYKKFTDPIEFVTLPNTTNQAGYNNNLSAYVYGVEAEFRVLLSTLFAGKNENTFLSKLTLAGNGAYMKSKVTLGNIGGISAESLGSNRPLQGQSPYIINASLGYNDEKTGLSSTLSLNRIGDRLAIAGNIEAADIYEKARTVMDFQIAKFLLKNKLEFKFNARDILSQLNISYFDYDKSQSFTEKDRVFSSGIAPKVFSFTATIKL